MEQKKVMVPKMSLSPEVLLSPASRERCISCLKQLPRFSTHRNGETQKYASVLMPLCVVDGEVCLLYTLRSTRLKNNSGQVSFPGGMRDLDESSITTALRETEEEIGVPPEDIEIWGQMHPVHSRQRNIIITPVIGFIKNFDIEKLSRSVDEVEEVFTVPMSSFCDTNNHGHLEFEPPLPLFIYNKFYIWGITGIITHMFLHCFLPEELYEPKFFQKKFTLQELAPSKL